MLAYGRIEEESLMHTRLCTILIAQLARPLCFVCVILAFSISSTGQSPLTRPVDDFLKQAGIVRAFGPASNSHLRVMRREEPALALAIIKLRRQASKTKPTATAEPLLVKAACAKWIGISRVLLRFGVEVSTELDKRIPTANEQDTELLDALDQSLHVALVKAEIQKFSGKGTYRGMFDSLKPRVKKSTTAFLFVFSDRLESDLIRAYAAEGLAQLCPQEMRKEVRGVVHEVRNERDETPFVKETAMIVLARLGERKLLNATLLKHRNIVAQELAKKSDAERSYPQLLLSYEKISSLLQRVGDIGEAAEINTDYLRLVLTLCNYKTQNPEARSSIAGQCYDFACQLSQLNRIDYGLHMLEVGFNWGLTAFDWAKEDKELSNLRKDPRFAILIDKWQKGKSKQGSMSFDDSEFLRIAGRIQKPTSKPTSQPTSKPMTLPTSRSPEKSLR